MIRRLVDRRWPLALGFALVLGVSWQLTAAAGVLPRYVLAPNAIVGGMLDAFRSGELLPAMGQSLRRQLTGFVLGATAGAVLGLLAGVWRAAEDVLDTWVSLTYPLPKIALFPVVVVWLGFSNSARILIIAVSCFYPAFVNALSGTRQLDPRMLWVARNVEAGRRRTFWNVVLRGSMPSVVTGLRISLALSFVLTYSTEAIGAGRDGLGHLISTGFDNLDYTSMYVGIVGFALLGLLADQIFTRVAGRAMRGQRIGRVTRV